MPAAHDSTTRADTPGSACLLVEAGGKRLACAFPAVLEIGRIDQLSPVPGGSPWLLGLIQWRGRLLTVVDAGRLFGYEPSHGGWLVVLRGLHVDTALAVDGILGTEDPDGKADVVLDSEALSAHPALQPGAAACLHAPDEAA
jgi:chemotaxis signal transduction protein